MAYFYKHNPVVVFYNDQYNTVPKDAIPISDKEHDAIFAGISAGKSVYYDENFKILALKDAVVEVITASRTLSSLQFIALFTAAEKDMLMQYARNNNQAMLWLITATGASYVDLNDPLTIEGLEYLVSLGVITNERFNEIKNTGL